MKTPLPACFLCFALLALPAAARSPNEKAARYLEPLLKRPGSGSLPDLLPARWRPGSK